MSVDFNCYTVVAMVHKKIVFNPHFWLMVAMLLVVPNSERFYLDPVIVQIIKNYKINSMKGFRSY